MDMLKLLVVIGQKRGDFRKRPVNEKLDDKSRRGIKVPRKCLQFICPAPGEAEVVARTGHCQSLCRPNPAMMKSSITVV